MKAYVRCTECGLLVEKNYLAIVGNEPVCGACVSTNPQKIRSEMIQQGSVFAAESLAGARALAHVVTPQFHSL